MPRGLPLDEQDVTFLVGDGIVTNAFGDDIQLALVEFDLLAIHFDSQVALQDEEQLVFYVVAVPGQRSVDLGDLDIGIVDFGHDAW
jgi:hypothetical protein